MVFQSYALFPHLTIFDNVAFGLRMRRIQRKGIKKRVDEVLQMVDLQDYADRRPVQLSGGQRQRVALARAIVIEPTLLLFDEPLSNLDAKLRVEMRNEIRRLQQRLGITALYVTHDQVEALAISDRVVVMNKGEIEQIGQPEAIYNQPETAFVADFMGFVNCFDADVTSKEQSILALQAQDYTLHATYTGDDDPQRVQVFFRPDAVALSDEPSENSLNGQVILRTFQGQVVEYIVETALGNMIIYMPEDAPRFEAHVTLSLKTERLIAIAYE
ncbi:MAG: ABC transporter ATP-binding protein [Anaerolineae bacterium]|nr:ABC transporter ATP-binding protein [Anaerolineae bacterium]